ncbi:MAG: ribonuclease III [Alphaproteobacteria bacterium]
MPADTKIIENAIGHSFKNKTLLIEALTHSSANAESNYERLEFLGDRVLGVIIAESLFEKFPDASEGDLAKRLAALVQGELLSRVARTIHLGDFLRLSDGEKGAGGAENDHLLADVMESLIGALYRDAGLESCRALIKKLWEPYFSDMKDPPQHPKTRLQEWVQGQGLPLPLYKVSGQEGPDHAPVFEVVLKVKDHADVKAEGRTRQAAEKEAARIFLERCDAS